MDDMPTGMTRRGARYSLRRRVPLDLIEMYGRKEITIALGTSDPKEARIRHARAWVEMDEGFAQMRASPSTAAKHILEPEARQSKQFDVDELAYKIHLSFRKKRLAYAAQGKLNQFYEEAKSDLPTYESILQTGDDFGMTIPEAEAMRNGLKAILDGTAITVPPSVLRAKDNPIVGQQLSLASLIVKWAAERKPQDRQVRAMKKVVERFEGVAGKLPVSAISKLNIVAFKDHLLASGQTAANVNTILTKLNTLFNFAADNSLIASNPASRISVIDKRRARDKRREFNADALASFFSSPVYAEGRRPAAGGGEAAYWLPVLALYTGARQTELGQLFADDVRQETYVADDGSEQLAWVIRIASDAARGQVTKTESSERRVPVHDALISLGFLDFAEQARRGVSERLFPDIKASAQGELMGNWTKWFGRYLRGVVGITDPAVVFHSFRHSFKHYARMSRLPAAELNEIVGHETGDVASDYGGLSYPLSPLVEAMARFSIPGFKLPNPPKGPRQRLGRTTGSQ